MPSGPRFAACSRTRRPPTSVGPVEEANRELVQKAGRTLHPLDKEGVWWFEKGDLVLSNQPDVVLAVLDGKVPSAVDHPRRVALLKARDDFQPVAAGFLDLERAPNDAPRGGPARSRRSEAGRVPVGLPGRCARDRTRCRCPRAAPGYPGSARSALVHHPVASAVASRLERLHCPVDRSARRHTTRSSR